MLTCPDVCSTCELLRSDLLKNLRYADRMRIASMTRVFDVPAGKRIIVKDQPVRDYVYIRRGLVEVKVVRTAENKIGVALGFPGDILGVGSLLQTVYEYTAETVTPLWACAIKVGPLRSFLHANPDFERELENRGIGTLFDRHLINRGGQEAIIQQLALLMLKVDSTIRNIPVKRGNVPTFPFNEARLSEVLGVGLDDVGAALDRMARAGAVVRNGPTPRIASRAQLRLLSPEREGKRSILASMPEQSPSLYGSRTPGDRSTEKQ